VFDESSFPAKDHAKQLLPSRLNASTNVSFLIPPSITPILSRSAPQPADLPLLSSATVSATSPLVFIESLLDSNKVSSPSLSLSPIVRTSPLPETVNLTEVLPASDNESHPVSQPICAPTSSASAAPHHSMITRSQTGSLKPKSFSDFHLYYTSKYPPVALHTSLSLVEPTCYTKATTDSRWRTAMATEFDALMANGTWTLCPRPLHNNVIRNKWVYKIKQHADGFIECFKARLVAKGFDQKCGLDYTETFSPVIKTATIRIVLALAVQFNWEIRQLDVSNAFLHGTLLEEVFMEQPQGFHDKDQPDSVCRLHKAIYGLKQALRAWFTCLSNALIGHGFIASLVDTSLFTFQHGDIKIFILIYVDDIIITGTHSTTIASVISKLQLQFPLKHLGPLHFFLGVQATFSSDGLHLCQTKYISDLLHRTRMLGAKPTKSPCSSGAKLSKFDGEILPDPSEYRHVVGALQYCTLTRPELAFFVNQLCQHMHTPSSAHWTAVKRVLRYLKATPSHGLFYSKGPLQLQAYCDSDWAGSLDDHRSTSGFCVFLVSCLISWSAKKQPVVSRSSTEGEYRSMTIATVELYWLRMLFKDLSIPLSHAPIL
jgi:hypothetical protein